MFDALEEVPWSSLRDAYGPAEKVPGHLRALLSHQVEERAKATAALGTSIVHQGTVYGATLAAVPFLVELAAHPAAPGRADAAFLLALIGDGNGFLEVHQRFLRRSGPEFERELALEREMLGRIRRTVGAASEILLPYLRSDHPARMSEDPSPAAAAFLRGCLARALARCAGQQPGVREALRDALEHEPESAAREDLREALELSGREDPAT